MSDRVIIDLCSGSGAWSKPYVEAGYTVERFELNDGHDVRLLQSGAMRAHGILCAPPCTVFSYARNRYEPADDELRAALSVVDACLRIVTTVRPVWWALENPINKVRRYIGEPVLTFRQWEYGGEAEKPTGIWGRFRVPKRNVQPRRKPSTFKTSTENARPEDAITPAGFARAFFVANP